MPIFLLLALMGAYIALTPVAEAFYSVQKSIHNRNDAQLRDRIADAVQKHYDLYQTYPTDLSALAALGTFNNVELPPSSYVRYARATGISDGTWTFDRATVYIEPNEMSAEEVLDAANNECGTDNFETSSDWCAPSLARAIRLESRAEYSKIIIDARLAMARTMHKFASFYQAFGVFPDHSDTRYAPAGESTSLGKLNGYEGTAVDCNQSSLMQGVSLRCDDFFTPTGNKVGYYYWSPTHIGLVVTLPVFRADGSPITISQEIEG